MVTLFYACLLALLMAVLGLRIPGQRRSARVSLGDGSDPELIARIRAFGNFVEWVPMILLLMLMIESFSGSRYFLHAVGILLILARIIHPQTLRVSGATKMQLRLRVTSTILTVSALIVSAIYGLTIAIPAMLI
ncbi:MAG: MAPEG family protein [Alphaproteobacteria bacterium]|nr:MAPEG family protein [Alphaproteobacteria bacterium]